MLVLSRKVGQVVTLTVDGHQILITVLECAKNLVKVGIEADRKVKVSKEVTAPPP